MAPKTNNMKLNNYHRIVAATPADVKQEVSKAMDILDRIHELLQQKFDGKQKLLAKALNKSEAEVSKWLNGVQNHTIKTLVKLEIVFGAPIIAVCSNDDVNATFVQVKQPYKTGFAKMYINNNGQLNEEVTTYSENKNITISEHKNNNIKADLYL